MSAIPPILDEAAIEAHFIAFVDGNRRAYEHCWDNCQRHTPNNPLPKWERLAIWLYATTSGFWYKRINDPLRAGHTLLQSVACVADHLANGLKKLPPYRGRVYRGIRVSTPEYAGFLIRYAATNLVTWRAFTSASINTDYAVTGNLQFTVESQNGRMLGAYADLKEEREVVFLPGTTVRVRGLEEDNARAIIYVEEVAPGDPTPQGR